MTQLNIDEMDSDWSEWDSSSKTCKICYGNDKDPSEKNVEWVSPCRCNGTIKWVHTNCLKQWIENAPIMQQSQCTTCNFPYRRCYAIKPLGKWTRPNLRLSVFGTIEIFLDAWSTVRLVKGAFDVAEGRRSLVRHMLYAVFWRFFIFNTQRVEYYKSLFRALSSSIFETIIVNAFD